jgi:hypothetical protein
LEQRAFLSAGDVAVTSVEDAYSAPVGYDIAISPEAGVLANDGGGGAPLTAVLVSPPAVGSLTFYPIGAFQYLPEPDFQGTVTFTYRATDGVAAGPETTVTLDFVVPNHEPWAGPMNATVDEDGATVPTPFPADDLDGDALVITISVAPEHGTVELTPDNKWVYTPEPGYSGIDVFRFRAFDGRAYDPFNDGHVNITVVPKADVPLVIVPEVIDAKLSGYVGMPITGSYEDPPERVGRARVKFSVVSRPAHGRVRVFKDGTFRYVPRAEFFGDDSFTIRARTRGVREEEVVEVEVISEDARPWAEPAADFVFYDTPAGYYASEQYAYIASDGKAARLLDHAGVIVVLHEGAAADVAPGEPLEADLIVVGTPGMDRVRVTTTEDGRASLFLNDRPLGTFYVTGAVRVYGLDGADWLIGEGALKGLELYGGGDYNFLQGSDGADLLYGGPYGDTLAGGAGDDVLVGGRSDGDELRGEAGSDLLLPGGTPFAVDEDRVDPPSADAALAAILSAWAAPTPFADRVSLLSAPGAALDPSTLPDDAPIPGVFDVAVGGDDLDWFVNVRPSDSMPDYASDEPLTE